MLHLDHQWDGTPAPIGQMTMHKNQKPRIFKTCLRIVFCTQNQTYQRLFVKQKSMKSTKSRYHLELHFFLTCAQFQETAKHRQSMFKLDALLALPTMYILVEITRHCIHRYIGILYLGHSLVSTLRAVRDRSPRSYAPVSVCKYIYDGRDVTTIVNTSLIVKFMTRITTAGGGESGFTAAAAASRRPHKRTADNAEMNAI